MRADQRQGKKRNADVQKQRSPGHSFLPQHLPHGNRASQVPAQVLPPITNNKNRKPINLPYRKRPGSPPVPVRNGVRLEPKRGQKRGLPKRLFQQNIKNIEPHGKYARRYE